MRNKAFTKSYFSGIQSQNKFTKEVVRNEIKDPSDYYNITVSMMVQRKPLLEPNVHGNNHGDTFVLYFW